MNRVHNFFPGPAALPLEALQCCQDELLDFAGLGLSIFELSHRTDAYEVVHNEAEALVRELLDLPENYHVMWIQGGGSLQFAMVPMNLLGTGQCADYIITGTWSQRAITEARKIGYTRVVATSEDDNFNHIPKQLNLEPEAQYVHLTSNNTIMGAQFHQYPDTGDVPLVGDMSSDMLSRKFDVSPFGIIFAGAHKNLGPSGATLVSIRDDLLKKCNPNLPTMLKYSTYVEHNSMFNTPVTFAIYMVRNVLRCVKERGGLEVVEAENRKKGELVYGFMDSTDGFYKCPIAQQDRSIMNVVFNLSSKELDEMFAKEAWNQGFLGLKNLPDRGGCRISMYNSVTLDSVNQLVDFMKQFMAKNG